MGAMARASVHFSIVLLRLIPLQMRLRKTCQKAGQLR